MSKVSPDDVYRYLHNELPNDYPAFLRQESVVKEPIPHPGCSPVEISNGFVQVERHDFFDEIVRLSKISGIRRDFSITYHPFIAARSAPCDDDECDCKESDNHMGSSPESRECFSISYVVVDPRHYSKVREWNDKVTAHNQSLDSRRRKIESNKEIASQNRVITDDARNKNLELWRFVAKELGQGHVPDLKQYKREMLLRQLAELE